MAKTTHARIYRFEVTACPREYGSDASFAGMLVIDAVGKTTVVDLVSAIHERTCVGDPIDTVVMEGQRGSIYDERTVDSLGLKVGSIIRAWGGSSLQLIVRDIGQSAKPAIVLVRVIEDRFDCDWLEELDRRASYELDREEFAAEDEDGDWDLSTDYRVQWTGFITDRRTGTLFPFNDCSRYDDLPKPSWLHAFITVRTDDRLPLTVGQIDLLGPDQSPVCTLDCRDRETWLGKSFDSLGVPMVHIEPGDGKGFDAYLLVFRVGSPDDARWEGYVSILVYSNAEFWKRKTRGMAPIR